MGWFFFNCKAYSASNQIRIEQIATNFGSVTWNMSSYEFKQLSSLPCKDLLLLVLQKKIIADFIWWNSLWIFKGAIADTAKLYVKFETVTTRFTWWFTANRLSLNMQKTEFNFCDTNSTPQSDNFLAFVDLTLNLAFFTTQWNCH